MDLKEAIKSEAQRLGFELVGITTADPPPHFDVFEQWLDAGRHGEMAYLASSRSRECRSDPRIILPECRSILVLGMRYPQSNPHPRPLSQRERGGNNLPPLPLGEGAPAELEQGEGRGRIASYAWGEDYHDLLPTRMQHLVAFIQQQVGAPVPHRIYTDTGPLLERELAQRAGLGWIGKNTCLIHPAKGSYFLLGEILLGVDLAPDQPFVDDRCGSCTRCLDACPTSCILPDRTIDTRRCISYLTIELKGSVPVELRSQMADWVFGCDICQQVCPWNERFARGASLPDHSVKDPIDPALQPRPGVPRPELSSEILQTPAEFNVKFKGSPVKRAKRRGYLRNVAIALGNSRPAGAEDSLADSLHHDPEPLVRAHAAWALGQIGGESPARNQQACGALQEAFELETDPLVIHEIRQALETCLEAGRKSWMV